MRFSASTNTTMRLIDVVFHPGQRSPGVDFRRVQILQPPPAFLAVDTLRVNGLIEGAGF